MAGNVDVIVDGDGDGDVGDSEQPVRSIIE
jgi:hypothetical protein